MSDRKIVVLGDVMLDEFIWGDVTRISPEAPVPVVDIRRESVHLGGAANVLANVVALGAKACVVGVVGNDSAGDRLRANTVGIDFEKVAVVVPIRQHISLARVAIDRMLVPRRFQHGHRDVDTHTAIDAIGDQRKGFATAAADRKSVV